MAFDNIFKVASPSQVNALKVHGLVVIPKDEQSIIC